MSDRISGREYRTTFICIDSYDSMIPEGRIYNPFKNGGESFKGTVDMLCKMETLLDSMNYPQSFNILRGFSSCCSAEAVPLAEEEKSGKAATFSVRILFRQNASWQGSVTWLEGGAEESFRSVLELLFLMNSALTEGTK